MITRRVAVAAAGAVLLGIGLCTGLPAEASKTPVPTRPGATGRAVTEVVRGQQVRVVKRLPPADGTDGTPANGPSDVAVGRDGRLYFTVGLGVRDQTRPRGRTMPAGPATDPNSVLSIGDGRLVADAGVNSLVRVNPRGRLSTVAVFPSRTVPGPGGRPVTMQAVPSSVVVGPDGAFYVGELTGFPYAKGAARIWRVVPGQRPTVYATGFTTIIDLAWGPGRTLYALELTRNGLLSGDQAGALLRVERPGPPAVVAGTGLTAPAGLAIRGHEAYVSSGGAVLRYVLR